MKRDSQPEGIYQTVGFYFRVIFEGLRYANKQNEVVDMRFQSVTGLDATLDTETIKEGGENGYEHVVPMRRKYGPLLLKRGVLKKDSALSDWFKQVFEDEQIYPLQNVEIQLLNESHDPLLFWSASWVWPKSWKIGELNAERSEVLIETLELTYNRIVMKTGYDAIQTNS